MVNERQSFVVLSSKGKKDGNNELEVEVYFYFFLRSRYFFSSLFSILIPVLLVFCEMKKKMILCVIKFSPIRQGMQWKF